MSSLEQSSGEFLTNTGSAIGSPRVGREHLENVVFTTPDGWTPPTAPPSTAASTTTTEPTTTTTTSGTSASTTTTTEPTTTTSEPTTTTTAAPSGPTGELTFQGAVQPISDGMCLVDSNGNLAQVSCDPATAPPLQIHTRPDGYVTLSLGPGTCFGTEGSNAASAVVNETCEETDDQLWQMVPAYDGTFQFKNKESGYCMDVSNNSGSSGAEIIQWGYGTSPNGSCKDLNSPNNHQFSLNDPTSTPDPIEFLLATDASVAISGFGTGGGVLTSNSTSTNSPNFSNTATFTFTVGADGMYKLQGSVNDQNNQGQDSFWVTVDGVNYAWNIDSNGSFANDYVNQNNDSNQDVTFGPFTAGQEITVMISNRESGAQLASLGLVKQ